MSGTPGNNLAADPLFCVEAKEKVTGKKFFINFGASKTVAYPKVDYDEEKLREEMGKRGLVVEEYKIPLISSPIFWTKKNKDNDERHYVVEIVINDKFAFRRIISSSFMRIYLVEVAMLCIEEKYNTPDNPLKSCGQFIGHKLDLNFRDYQVIEGKQRVERSEELVNNKVTVLEDLERKGEHPVEYKLQQGVFDKDCDLYYRPKSGLLTCSILTSKIPDSISFSEDRIVVKLGELTLIDVYLPLNIDLKEPMKYRFYDTLGIFKAVFKVVEPK